MQVDYCPYDPESYAIGLHVEQGRRLEWASSRGQEVLVVRTPFGQLPDERMEELCDALAAAMLVPNQFTEVCPDLFVRLMTAADKAREGGCYVTERPATYSVYACRSQGGRVERIFAPQMNAMNKHYCHVMLETSVAVEPLTYRKKKPFSKKEEWLPTPYFMLHLPQNIADAYHDGDMVYAVGALEIPITRAMLAQGTVYVMSGSVKPVVKSNNPGLALH